MKQILAIALLSATTSLLLAQSAVAQAIQTGSGQPVLVAGITDWDARCRAKNNYAQVVITRNPSHGTLRIKRGVKLPIPKTNISGKCAGKTIRGVAIYYQSRNGYRGNDWVKFKAKPVDDRRFYPFTAKIRVR